MESLRTPMDYFHHYNNNGTPSSLRLKGSKLQTEGK